jgi:hypothetical protein
MYFERAGSLDLDDEEMLGLARVSGRDWVEGRWMYSERAVIRPNSNEYRCSRASLKIC